MDDGANRVQHIAAGQIKCGRELCLSGGFRVSLPVHDLCTGKTQLHPGIGVDGVVDTAVVRAVAAGHVAVGSVDDGITFQGGNVPLPEVQPRLQGRQVSRIGDAFCGDFLLQVRILYLQKVCADTPWFTDIQQAPQKLPLGVCVCRYPQSPILRVFFQKHLNKDRSPLTLVHGVRLPFKTFL